MGCQSGGVPTWDRIAKLVDPCVRRRHRSLLRRISLPLEVSMVPKYDIFRKTNDSVVGLKPSKILSRSRSGSSPLHRMERTTIESGIQPENSSSTCWTIAPSCGSKP